MHQFFNRVTPPQTIKNRGRVIVDMVPKGKCEEVEQSIKGAVARASGPYQAPAP